MATANGNTHQIPADTTAVKLLDDNGDSGAEQWKSMVDFVDMNVLWDIDTLSGRHTVWKSDSGETDNQDGRITPQTSDSAESDNQRRRASHTLISEPTTTSATPIQNGMPNATPNRSVLEAVENSGVAYEPIASVSILPCSMPYPQHA